MFVAWVRSLVSARAATAVLSSFGALWLIVEIAAFFFQSTAIPQWLRDHWWLFAIIGAATAVIKCRPKMAVAQKLNGRDVTVEMVRQ